MEIFITVDPSCVFLVDDGDQYGYLVPGFLNAAEPFPFVFSFYRFWI